MLRELTQVRPFSVVVLKARVEEGEALDGEFERLGEVVGSTCNILHQIRLTRSRECRQASEHLIEDTTKGPNIGRLVVGVAVQYFWCHD